MKTFKDYLSSYQDIEIQRDKGTIFEDATMFFLENDAVYKQQFKRVFTWSDWIDYDTELTGTPPYSIPSR